MPPPAVAYVPTPYVRSGTIGELIRLRGRNAADAELRRGQISADMWSNLGNTIAGSINQYAQQRQDAPRLARQAEAEELSLQDARDQREQQQRLTRQDTAFMALLEQQDRKSVV